MRKIKLKTVGIYVTILLLGTAYFYSFNQIGTIINNQNIVFDSDEFHHSAPAIDFLVLFERGEYSQLGQRILKESFYPPLHPLLLSAYYKFTNISFESSRTFSLLLFFLAIIISGYSSYLLAKKLNFNTSAKLAALIFTILAALTCKIALYGSTICMVEPLGMLITSMIIFVLVKSYPNNFKLSNAIVLSILCFALFFTKYTFLALILPGLFFANLERINNTQSLKKFSLWFGLFSAILLPLALLWFTFCNQDSLNYYLHEYHTRGWALGFNSLLYYPEIIFKGYFAKSWIAGIMMVLILVTVYKNWDNYIIRISFLSLLWSCLLFGLIAERLARHILAIAPFLWLLSGFAVAYFANNKNKFSRICFSPITYSVIILVYCFTFYNSQEKIQKRIVQTMEYREVANGILYNHFSKIQAGQNFVFNKNTIIPLKYNLDWYIAKQNRVTLSEARQKKIKVKQ